MACCYVKQPQASSLHTTQDTFAVDYLNWHMLNEFLFVNRHGKGYARLRCSHINLGCTKTNGTEIWSERG